MNKDATIVQVAIFLIIIAILGVAILKQQRSGNTVSPMPITPIKEAKIATKPIDVVVETTGSVSVPEIIDPLEKPDIPTELSESDNLNIVKQYFRAIAEKDYATACSLIAGSKCNATTPFAVENFSIEFNKLVAGYEYINIKDYGFTAPSGKDIVCVKYNYRYKDDAQPDLVSEIMSFYVDEVGGELKITDRVCEKKYKDTRGVRDCPIQAAAKFCEGWVK